MAPAKPGCAQPSRYAFAALLIGNVALALGPWFVRWADTGPVAAGFWRLLLALPALFLLARHNGQPVRGLGRVMFATLLISGLFFAADLASWHTGIIHTKLANATLFGNCASLILVLYGFLVSRTAPTRMQGLALGLAGVGSIMLMGQSYEISPQYLLGDLLCLLAGLFYACYLVVMQRARAELGNWSVLALSTAAGVLPILGIALAMGEQVMPHDWTPLIILAISSQIVGQGLLIYALGHFPPLIVGLALLTQPAVAAIVGWLAFRESLSPIDAAGALCVGTALVLVRLPQRQAKRAPAQ